MTTARNALLASLLAAGVAGAAACAANSAAERVDGSTNEGMPDGDARSDVGPPTPGGDALAPMPETVLYVLHAGSPDLRAFRVCLADDQPALPSTGTMPQSNYPGVPPGGVVSVGAVTVATGTPLTVSLVDARALALAKDPNAKCSSAVTDFQGETLAGAVTLVAHAVNLLVISGDRASRTAVVARLDATYLGSAAPAPPELHAQLGQFSKDPAALAMQFSARGGGSVTDFAVVAYGSVSKVSGTAFPPDGGFGDYGVTATPPGVFTSLADVLKATDPTATPSAIFLARQNVAFFYVGGYAPIDGGNPSGYDPHWVATPIAQ